MTDAFAPQPPVRVATPAWAHDGAIYQINLRQFTADGTLRAAQAHLPRLAAFGATILWLMPIHPIGQKNRKGRLGSPYAVRDYGAVSDEFGTLGDLRDFVAEAHRLGMKVILDWVANHTAPDHVWAEAHPDWYRRDSDGQMRATPWWDWDDIVDLDYTRPTLRRAMAEAMRFWVDEADVDGFRCDVAGYVPLDFWAQARRHLEAVKPVFLLAEWEDRDLHADAFDASYAWTWEQAIHRIARGEATADALRLFYAWNTSAWPREALRMTFATNHDKNAWDGTPYDLLGPVYDAAIALSCVGAGIPLVYNGQEIGLDRRLPFFDRAPLVWPGDADPEHPHGALYRRLLALRRATTALHAGAAGAPMQRVPTDGEPHVLAFVRQNDAAKVLAVFNFSAAPRRVVLTGPFVIGAYADAITGEISTLADGDALDLPAWGYRVLIA